MTTDDTDVTDVCIRVVRVIGGLVLNNGGDHASGPVGICADSISGDRRLGLRPDYLLASKCGTAGRLASVLGQALWRKIGSLGKETDSTSQISCGSGQA